MFRKMINVVLKPFRIGRRSKDETPIEAQKKENLEESSTEPTGVGEASAEEGGEEEETAGKKPEGFR